jgi:hypothetical protein
MKSIPHGAGPLGLCLALAACGPEPDALRTFFADEFVEAPARSLRFLAFRQGSCETVNRVPFSEVGGLDLEVLADRTVPYPPASDSAPLEGLPRGSAFVLAAAALDGEGLVVGRACRGVRLGDGSQIVELNLRLHLDCPSPPTQRLVATVVEVSDAMFLGDIAVGESVASVFSSEFYRPAEQARHLLVLPDGGEVRVVGPTADVAPIRAELDRLSFQGLSRIHDGVVRAVRELRDRMSCRTGPVAVLAAAGPDRGSSRFAREAILALDGVDFVPEDDIPAVGIGLGRGGVDALQALLVPPDPIYGGSDQDSFTFAVQQARRDALGR